MGLANVLYAVVSHEGKLRKNRQRCLMIYDTLAMAQRCARRDGDSVVELHLNLDREPLFTRKKVMK